MEEKKYYTAKEAGEILGMTYSALRHQVKTGQIHSITPPGKRQAVYVKEDVDQLARTKEKKYYTAKEAGEILGMTYSALRNQVDAGNIHSITPPGKRQAVYVKEDVDQLARELKIFMATKKRNPTIFTRATTREELLESAKLSDAIFGGHIDVDRQMAWIARNPDICYVAKNEGKVVGYAIMLPLSFEKIEKLLREEEYTVNIEANGTYGSRLVSGLMKVIIDLGRKGVIIKTIVARSTKPDGIRLLRDVGFTEILSTTDKKNFMIEVEKSGIKEIMQYKQALRESGVFAFPQDLSELPTPILPETESQTEREQRT